MRLKPTTYQRFNAASGPPTARLGAPEGRQTPPGYSEALQKPKEIVRFQKTCEKAKNKSQKT